jgi:hypothetical protein
VYFLCTATKAARGHFTALPNAQLVELHFSEKLRPKEGNSFIEGYKEEVMLKWAEKDLLELP